MGILNSIFQLSVRGSIIFFIFLILKPVTKKYFNSSWHYKILVLILLSFLIPINNFINLPVKPIINIPSLEIEEEVILQDINLNEEISNIEGNNAMERHGLNNKPGLNLKNENLSLAKSGGENLPKISFNIGILKKMITYIWLIGGISLLAIKILQYIKFKSFVLKHWEEVEEDKILNVFNTCREELGLNKKVGLKICRAIESPMLIGIFKPIVLIPTSDEKCKRLKMIFLHELNHCKRRDILTKVFALIINAVHWFNPFVYILLGEMDKYCEYSIDEKVVEEMSIKDRKYYGETILSLIGSSMIMSTSFTRSMTCNGKQLKTRLENMIYSFKTSRSKALASVLIGILIFVSGFTVACSVLPENSQEEKAIAEVDLINDNNNPVKTTDVLKGLANKEFFIKDDRSNKSTNDLVIEFGQSFVNLFTGAVAGQDKVAFDKYISNENLLKFMDKLLELTQIQEAWGDNAINYGLENKFADPTLRQHPGDQLWYLELPFEFEGSGIRAKMLIGEENKALKLLDIYFGTKDGIDTFATGHPADRKVKDPGIWEDEDWVRDVFERLEEFEFEVDIPHRAYYHDPYANPPINIDIEPGRQRLTKDEIDLYIKYRKPNAGTNGIDGLR